MDAVCLLINRLHIEAASIRIRIIRLMKYEGLREECVRILYVLSVSTYQLTIQAMLMAVATYFASNISATINHGIGPNPISETGEEEREIERYR